MFNDDIAAISTAPGEAGIAIVRMSGCDVIEKVAGIFKPLHTSNDIRTRPSHTLTLGWIIDEQKEAVDEVLIGLMKAPRSYTGEDVVEINCHGGTLAARRCLELALQTGIRIAEPGEFSRRSFLNGRMDVSQAEAVIEVIRAKTEKGLKLAVKQLSGHNSRQVQNLEERLIYVNALLEASLDFPDEVGEPDYEEIRSILQEQLILIDKILDAAQRAEIYREGIKVVICGKPNVGKSSLLNMLLRQEKAIVTSIPGTTRDIIEDYINVHGIPVKLMDTAGIRSTEDIVERIGVERSEEVIKNADIVLLLLDVEAGITDEDTKIYEIIDKRKAIILVNKEDLEAKNISGEQLDEIFQGVKIIRGSVKEETGLEELEDSIEKMVLSGKLASDDLETMINLRQKAALLQAKKHLQETLEALGTFPLDCLGVDIWGALESLGQVTGKNLKEEIMDRIFHEFCIGK
ncbi:MAG: tRNA uridine-5-carboxymethylaminomethyl(34) synthesis GTPase MnmE [Syntrophomonadaceae bacterium]|nr:tRNA uridine-5-carboxymethylaminomethyl(34) synthesis GTPase MnmE [Syntrophomonadaceae bacterium]